MLMRIRKPSDVNPSEITGESVYHERRRLIQSVVGAGLLAAAGPALVAADDKRLQYAQLSHRKNEKYRLDQLTPWEDITSYNNFYEYGTSKKSPARLAGSLRTRPWSVNVSGECNRPGDYDFEDILKNHPLEERVYRFRCVEAWSMVVPWLGFPLADLLKRFEPNSRARYVAFTTLHDPEQMPGQRRAVLRWPYVEGLRIDEAMHPLTIMVTGLYGRVLPNQNGAPLRLIVPWKYGFKSIKSIVSIRFTENQPPTSWNLSAPREYGFYSNVNPSVDHPRWSQKRERRLGGFFLSPKQDTLLFNGYADEVGELYAGLDLSTYY